MLFFRRAIIKYKQNAINQHNGFHPLVSLRITGHKVKLCHGFFEVPWKVSPRHLSPSSPLFFPKTKHRSNLNGMHIWQLAGFKAANAGGVGIVLRPPNKSPRLYSWLRVWLLHHNWVLFDLFALTFSESLLPQSSPFSQRYSMTLFHRYMKCSIERARNLSRNTTGHWQSKRLSPNSIQGLTSYFTFLFLCRPADFPSSGWPRLSSHIPLKTSGQRQTEDQKQVWKKGARDWNERWNKLRFHVGDD